MTIVLNFLPKPKGGSSSASEDAVFYTKDLSILDPLEYKVVDITRPNRWKIPKGYLYYEMVHDGKQYIYTVLRNMEEKKYCFLSLSGLFFASFPNNKSDCHFVYAYDRIFTYSDKRICVWDTLENSWFHYTFSEFDPVEDSTNFYPTFISGNVLCLLSTSATYDENVGLNIVKHVFNHYFFQYYPDRKTTRFINKVDAKYGRYSRDYVVFPNLYIRLTSSGSFKRFQIQESQSKYDFKELDEITIAGSENYDPRYGCAVTFHQNQIVCYSYCYGLGYRQTYFDYFYRKKDMNSLSVSFEKKGSEKSSSGNLLYRYYWNSIFNIYINSDTILCYTSTNSEKTEYAIYKMNPSNPDNKEIVIQTNMDKYVVYPLPGLPVICVDDIDADKVHVYMGALPYFPMFLPKGSYVNNEVVTEDGEMTYPKSGEKLTIQPSQEFFGGTIFAQQGDKGYSF